MSRATLVSDDVLTKWEEGMEGINDKHYWLVLLYIRIQFGKKHVKYAVQDCG